MQDLTSAEKELLGQLEDSVCCLNTLCAMLDRFEESDPFSSDSSYLNPDARAARRLRAIRFLSGLRDLACHYAQNMDAALGKYYPGN